MVVGLALSIPNLNAANSGSGCAGDCMTCHPKLVGDEQHKTLTTCIQCHDPTKPKVNLFSNHPEGCGGNCFECHDEWPKDGHHAELYGCQDCHKK